MSSCGDEEDDVPEIEQSVVASDSAVVMQAAGNLTVHGDITTGGRRVPEMELVSPPRGVGRFPMVSGSFVGRDGELRRLEEAVSVSGRAVMVAVHGLGGVGKSTVAARFAQSRGDRVSFIWWVVADSPTALNAGLADLASAVAPEVAQVPLEQRVELGVRWLATHDDWLLVLDNLAGLDDAKWLLERVRTGMIVITSRKRLGWGTVETIAVDVLPPGQAEELLSRLVRAEWSEADLTGSDLVCAELGHLPLAVEQAAAYMAQTHITCAKYLDSLAKFPARMFTATVEDGDTQRTMARVWHITLGRFASTPLVGQVLRVLAWCAPDAIPRSFLHGLADELDVEQALGKLSAHSMITLTDTVTVHRLVQAVTRTSDAEDPFRQPGDIIAARKTVTAAIARVLADLDFRRPETWLDYEAVLPHALALFDHTTPDDDTADTCDLLGSVAHFLRDQGAVKDSVVLYARAALSAHRLHGDRHAYTLACLNNLASAHVTEGDLSRAISLFEALVDDCEGEVGRDNPLTVAVRGNLANAYRRAGVPVRAIPLEQRTLADRERLFGPDHPDTFIARNNLGSSYETAGDLAKAIPLYARTLADRERVLGPDHPDTLNSRNNLANAYKAAGKPNEALALHRSTLVDRERVLGLDHPETLASQANLADHHKSIGDLTSAIPLYEATLANRERVLGSDHPDTLASRSDLADAYKSAGNITQAISLHHQTLTDRERLLGPSHTDTLISRGRMASAYLAAGNVERAISLHEEVVADFRRTAGLVHPNTLASLGNLARAYMTAGKILHAKQLYRETLAGMEKTLGTEHLTTLAARSDLATVCMTAGDVSSAIPLYEAIIATSTSLLGTAHADTLACCSHLATAYEAAGDLL